MLYFLCFVINNLTFSAGVLGRDFLMHYRSLFQICRLIIIPLYHLKFQLRLLFPLCPPYSPYSSCLCYMRITTSVKIQSSLFLLRLSAPLAGHNYTIKMANLKTLVIDSNGWETLASERSAWRQEVQQGLPEFEGTLAKQAGTKRQTRDRPEILITSAHCAEHPRRPRGS